VPPKSPWRQGIRGQGRTPSCEPHQVEGAGTSSYGRRIGSLPVEEIAIGTNGTTAAIETARTDLDVALPYQSFEQAPLTMGESMSATTQTRSELGNVADVIIVASLLIAGCSLAVGVTAGISDRKRPFSLLRLTGVPVGILRRVVALEAALPLVVAAVLVTVVGLLGAELFLRSQLDVSIRWPGLLYWLVVVIRIVVSLGLIVSPSPSSSGLQDPKPPAVSEPLIRDRPFGFSCSLRVEMTEYTGDWASDAKIPLQPACAGKGSSVTA